MLPYYEWPSLENIAREVQSGARTARFQVEHALKLAKQETLNSLISPTFISLDPEGALAMADALDAKIKRGEACGDLCGVPFAVKDNIDVAGLPTTAACPDFAYTPTQSAFAVQRLSDAGALGLGKTNLDQFATGLVSVRSP